MRGLPPLQIEVQVCDAVRMVVDVSLLAVNRLQVGGESARPQLVFLSDRLQLRLQSFLDLAVEDVAAALDAFNAWDVGGRGC